MSNGMKAEVGKRYQHYKNQQTYTVLAIARHTEAGEDLVVYQGHYDTEDLGSEPIFARPKEMWEEDVEYNGETLPRFSLIESA